MQHNIVTHNNITLWWFLVWSCHLSLIASSLIWNWRADQEADQIWILPRTSLGLKAKEIISLICKRFVWTQWLSKNNGYHGDSSASLCSERKRWITTWRSLKVCPPKHNVFEFCLMPKPLPDPNSLPVSNPECLYSFSWLSLIPLFILFSCFPGERLSFLLLLSMLYILLFSYKIHIYVHMPLLVAYWYQYFHHQTQNLWHCLKKTLYYLLFPYSCIHVA